MNFMKCENRAKRVYVAPKMSAVVLRSQKKLMQNSDSSDDSNFTPNSMKVIIKNLL